LHIVSEHILSSQELRDLTTQVYYRKIRSMLAAQNKESIPYEKYLEWCSLYGLSTEQAATLCKALHQTGVILHFSQNEELKGTIFLKAERVGKVLEECIQLKFLTTHAPQLRKELNDLLPLYLPLNEKKLQLDAHAKKRAKLWMYGALAYLGIQFSILAKMVWIDFNWDIMEPITYYVGVFTLLGGFTFFVLYGEDYTYRALEKRQEMLALKKVYLSQEFNWQKWNKLHQRVQLLSGLLGEKTITQNH